MSDAATLETASPHEAQPPVLFLGGYGNTEKMNKANTEHIASTIGATALHPPPDIPRHQVEPGYTISKFGRKTKTVSLARAAFSTPKPEVSRVTAKHQQNRARQIIEHVESNAEEPIQVIFQSADALAGVIAVHERPDLFDSVVFAHPAGLIKKQSITEHSRRMFSSLRSGAKPVHVPERDNDFLMSKRRQKPEESPRKAEGLREKVAAYRRHKKGNFNATGGFPIAASVAVSYQNMLLHEARKAEDAPAVSLVLGMNDAMMDPVRTIESLISPDDVDSILITNTAHGINGDMKVMEAVMGQLAQARQVQAERKQGTYTASLAERIVFMPDVSEQQRQRVLQAATRLQNSPLLQAA